MEVAGQVHVHVFFLQRVFRASFIKRGLYHCLYCLHDFNSLVLKHFLQIAFCVLRLQSS